MHPPKRQAWIRKLSKHHKLNDHDVAKLMRTSVKNVREVIADPNTNDDSQYKVEKWMKIEIKKLNLENEERDKERRELALEKEQADALARALPTHKRKRKGQAALPSSSGNGQAVTATPAVSTAPGQKKRKTSTTASASASSYAAASPPSRSRVTRTQKRSVVYGVTEPDGSMWEDASSILGNFVDNSEDSEDSENNCDDDEDEYGPPIASTKGKKRALPEASCPSDSSHKAQMLGGKGEHEAQAPYTIIESATLYSKHNRTLSIEHDRGTEYTAAQKHQIAERKTAEKGKREGSRRTPPRNIKNRTLQAEAPRAPRPG
ncbi:hypothetical protein DXG03_008799 [Asterophora parasitica]|uniref:Uncharacterized protein n=1 Tax=Asterophora parasitica TaxID=117018 RepID=A0A9P7KA64_9AGAR|nr:hypothetical protein DXG03_008799 [Asterophora parasitica]